MNDRDEPNEDPASGPESGGRSADPPGGSPVRSPEYQAIFEQVSDGIFVHDSDGRILDANRTVLEQLGFTREELLSMEVTDIEVGLDETLLEEQWRSMEAGSTERLDVEGTHRRKDGSTFPVDVRVSKLDTEETGRDRFVALARDITERKARERTIEEQRDFLEETIEGLPYPFYVLNVEDYTVEYANSLATVGEGDTCYEITHDRGQPCDEGDSTVTCPLSDVVESGEPTAVEHAHHNDGKEGVYKVYASPIFDDDGTVVRIAESNIDITERVEYERKLEEQRDTLEILNQVVRHDIRNDMTVVRGRANLLAEHVEEAGREDLEAIQEATENAIELTKTARDFSETMLSSEEDVGPVRLDRHLETPVDNARSEFESAIITLEDRISDVRVRGNDLLEAVFRNLVRNAIIHNDAKAPEVRISIALDEKTATVAVADNGPGIPDDRKESVFGEGEKGLDSPGTGLGLYLVQTLVDRYDGDVWIEDNDPTGSVFYVELPRVTAE